jgi:hypothetical protein
VAVSRLVGGVVVVFFLVALRVGRPRLRDRWFRPACAGPERLRLARPWVWFVPWGVHVSSPSFFSVVSAKSKRATTCV